MIFNLLLNLILLVFGSLFVFFPVVAIADIPYVGSFLSSTLIQMIQVWNAFLITFPYAVTGWHIFLWVILPFEVLLLVMKFFLGHHVPTHN